MLPVVHGLEEEFGDRIRFVYLDMDNADTAPLMAEVNFTYRPHFSLVSESGEIVEQWVGSVEEAVFRVAFEELLNS